MQVLSTKYIVEALKELRNLNAHRNILMYLCIKRSIAKQITNEPIKVDFREFFERFLTVKDAPSGLLNKPYIIPFESSDAKLWFNRNVAGSFSPSSIRNENPINTLVKMQGKGSQVKYLLKLNHAAQAFHNLLNAKKIPVLSLAIFIYRDFGFSESEMDHKKLIQIFKDEFGYNENGFTTSDYDVIYSEESDPHKQGLFVPFAEI